MIGRTILRLSVLLLAGMGRFGAQPHTSLSGSILDPSGAGVAGAAIQVVDEDSGFRRFTVSQIGGSYFVAPLEAGTYKVTVRREGFRTTIRFGIRLSAAQAGRVDFTLPLGSMQETVTVEGVEPLMNTLDAAVTTRVAREQIQELPVNGRNLLGLLELAPGTLVTPATRGEAGQFTANGQRPNKNYFTVDGISINNGVSAGGLPAQSTGASLPAMSAFGGLYGVGSLESLDQVEMQTSTSPPEQGRLPGAQVAIRSRSGTNDWHGSLSHFFRHEKIAANDWFANRHGEKRAPLRLNDFGAALAGPLVRNRAFFFAAYEGIRLRQPFAWRAAVPSMELRGQIQDWVRPLVELFPEPNGPELTAGLTEWTGRNQGPSRLNTGVVRLDWAASSKLTLFARYTESPSSSQFGSGHVNQLDLSLRSVTAGLNARLLPSLVLDTRINMTASEAFSLWVRPGAPRPVCAGSKLRPAERRDPSLCDHLIRVAVAGAGQISSGREGLRKQIQWQLVQAASWSLGSHQLRAGYDGLRLAPRFRDDRGGYNLMAEALGDLRNSGNLWAGYSEPQAGSSVLYQSAVYAQDTWRIHPRLTATYGLRWDFAPDAVTRQPAYALDPGRGQITSVSEVTWPPRFSRVAPRVGAAWLATRDQATVVRFGAGLFYDTNPGTVTDAVNSGPFNVQQYGSGRFAPFSGLLSYGYVPLFVPPRALHWNVSVERALSKSDAVSAGYVGSAGSDLVRREMGGPGSTQTIRLAIATNHGESEYQGLQLQYRRRYSKNVQALVSYAWGHSIDNSSTDSLLHWAGAGFDPRRDRGSSDFDVRHTLTASLSYEVARGWLRGVGFDSLLRARTGFPVDILEAEQPMGLNFANVFRPDVVAGQAVWVEDALSPGGRRLNAAAFRQTPGLQQGNLGRNAIAGFGMGQIDLAVRRTFYPTDRFSFDVRLEAFNLLNHPSFADPVRFLANPLFGAPASMLNLMLGTGSPGSGLAPIFQSGGARSAQVSLRMRF